MWRIGASYDDRQTYEQAPNAQGREAFVSGRFECALLWFFEAYGSRPDPNLLYNIGQTYRQIGDCRAVAYYQRYLAAAANATNVAGVQKSLADMHAHGCR